MNVQEKIKEIITSKHENKELSKLTQEEWNEIYTYLKEHNSPTAAKRMERGRSNTNIVQRTWGLSCDDIETQDKRYCNFINDVLKNIRQKKKSPVVDSIYHLHNLIDLLKFEPDMQSELVHDEGLSYIKVWLVR